MKAFKKWHFIYLISLYAPELILRALNLHKWKSISQKKTLLFILVTIKGGRNHYPVSPDSLSFQLRSKESMCCSTMSKELFISLVGLLSVHWPIYLIIKVNAKWFLAWFVGSTPVITICDGPPVRRLDNYHMVKVIKVWSQHSLLYIQYECF